MTRKNFITTICLFATMNAMAQTDTLQGKSFEEVVVTANKYEQKQSTTGKVITVITKEQLEKSQSRSVAQLLNEQAGITINGALNNAGSVQTLFMRGAGSGRTLVLLDGIPVSDPSMINNEFDLNLMSMDNIERIEICKGAQSTLYGSDAIAGVINIITYNKDAAKPFNIKSTLSAGNLGTFKGNVHLYGKKDKLTYSARYAHLSTNGFSAAYDSVGNKGFDKDNYSGNVANAQLLFQANKKLSFKTFMLYSQYNAGIDAGIFRDDRDYNISNKSFTTGSGFAYKTDAINLVGNYQYSDVTRRYINDSAHKTNVIYEDNEYYGKNMFTELYAGIKLGNGFTLLQGADFRIHSFNQHYFSISSFGPYKSEFKDTNMSQSGLYASLNYASANNKFNAEFGGRLNTHSRYGSNLTYTFNPSYSFSKKVRVFGSVASGFKAPTLYQLSFNTTLQPEKAVNYEAGIQYNQKKWNTRLVYFNRKINNGLDYNYITFTYFNFVKQVVNGLEFEATFKPSTKWTISGNYTFIDASETTQNRKTNNETIVYDYSLRRPKHSVNATIAFKPTAKLYFSASGKVVSKRHDVGGYQKADVLLDGYLLLGAFAEYTMNSRFRFFVDAQNITNKQFFDVRGYNAIPFLINTGVSVSL